MLKIIQRKKFEKEAKKAKKRGRDMKKLKAIIIELINNKPLSPKNRNHKLQGEFEGYWECHIEPDWLLIYKKTSSEIILVRKQRWPFRKNPEDLGRQVLGSIPVGTSRHIYVLRLEKPIKLRQRLKEIK